MERRIKQEDRISRILRELQVNGVIHIAELSQTLQVSPATIRKDLLRLEEVGRLSRVSGGAVAHAVTTRVFGSDCVPRTRNMELKQCVAKEAAKLIHDRDSLIVTSGATPHLTAIYASQCKNLRILTDSLNIAEDLCRRKDYQVIILGGEVYTRDCFIHGRDAVSQVVRYMADKAIMTMDGVDAKVGLSTLRVEGADTLKSIMARARERIIVADITKIGEESFCHIGDISMIDVLVTNKTDNPAKMEILRQIENAGVKVRYADITCEDRIPDYE
ncbi:MAG: DeoR/GlpR family DNA-binding transcription regulator [Clostridiaceae bacterium]